MTFLWIFQKRKSPKKTQNDQQALQSWALIYTRAVRQRAVRQVTMAKMGTEKNGHSFLQ